MWSFGHLLWSRGVSPILSDIEGGGDALQVTTVTKEDSEAHLTYLHVIIIDYPAHTNR